MTASREHETLPESVSLRERMLNWKTIASVVVALVILALAFRTLGVNLGRTWQTISEANLALLGFGFVAFYLTIPVRGFRWWFILRGVGTRVRYRDATEILFLSWFVNCVVPAKLGDLYRAYLLRGNAGVSGSHTVGTVFIERIADVIAIFVLALAAGYWSFRGRSRTDVDAIFLVGSVVALVLVLLVVILRFWGGRLTRALPARMGELWERFHEGSTGALTLRAFPVIAGTTVMIWLLEGARLYFVIQALALPDVGLGISASVFVALVAALLTAMPLTPAGIGFVEAGIAGALLVYGVEEHSAAAVALTDRGISVISIIIIGGAFYLLSPKVRRAHATNARLASG